MSYDEATKAAHLELSQADWDLRQMALENPEYRRRSSFPLFGPHPAFFFDALQPWPTFVQRSKLEELVAGSLTVSRLVRSVLERVFENDPAAIGRYFDIANPAMVRIMMSKPHGIDEALSRGDFIMTESGFKCIELNVGANIDGWQTAFLAEMHLKTPLTAKFIQEKKLEVSYTDSLNTLFKHILQDARTLFPDSGEPLNVAFGFQPEAWLETQAVLPQIFEVAYKKACEEAEVSPDGQLFVCCPEEFSLQADGSLKLGEHRIHLVVAAYGSSWPSIYRSYKTGKIKLYNSPVCDLLSDKRVLAMLSMLAETDLVDDEEKRLIEQVIPWTRTFDVPPVLQQVYQTISTAELVERREGLVLKRSDSMGGKGVHVGRFTSPQEWASVVEIALGSPNWVIQEYLQSVPFLYQNGDEGCTPHNVIWGPFVFGQSYGGMFLRMQPQATRTPINLSLTANYGMAFELD